MVIIQVGWRKPWRLQTCRRTVGHACTETNCQSVSPVWSHLYSFLYCSVSPFSPKYIIHPPALIDGSLTLNTLACQRRLGLIIVWKTPLSTFYNGCSHWLQCNLLPSAYGISPTRWSVCPLGEILVHSSRLLSEGLFLPFEYKNKRRIRWLSYIGLNPTHYFETNFSW